MLLLVAEKGQIKLPSDQTTENIVKNDITTLLPVQEITIQDKEEGLERTSSRERFDRRKSIPNAITRDFFLVKALWDNEPEEDGELSFVTGDIIKIVTAIDDEWY